MIFEEYERRANPNPHPKFGVGTGPVGATWNPSVRGMRADARNTDNLRGMRESAIYLFAERSGNELIRKLYKDRLQRTAASFFGVGNGEWDSPTYHPHTVCAYLNLYAFAQDESVRKTAKAILDFTYAAGGLKYWRGAWCGPNKRDYGNYAPMQAAGGFFWLQFGDAAPAAGHHADWFGRSLQAIIRQPRSSRWRTKNLRNQLRCLTAILIIVTGCLALMKSLLFMKPCISVRATISVPCRAVVEVTSMASAWWPSMRKKADMMVAASGSTKRLHTGSGQDRVAQYQNLSIIVAPSQSFNKKKGLMPNKLHWAQPAYVPLRPLMV